MSSRGSLVVLARWLAVVAVLLVLAPAGFT